MRGRAHGPIDGREDTRYSNGSISEWTTRYGIPSISYNTYNGNNGLHITLPDETFNKIILRGDWEGLAFKDYNKITKPGAEVPVLANIKPEKGVFRKSFEKEIKAEKISFFYKEKHKKQFRNISFLKTSDTKISKGAEDKTYSISKAAKAPVKIAEFIKLRFKADNPVYAAAEGKGNAVSLEKDKFIHLITPEQDRDTGISAVTFDLDVTECSANSIISLRVQDTLDPRREIMGIDILIPAAGKYSVTLDIPDQVFLPKINDWKNPPRMEGELLPPPVVWLAVSAEQDMKLNDISATIHNIEREKALKETAQWRIFLLKGLVQAMSEPRPWCLLSHKKPIREQINTSKSLERYKLSLTEVMENGEITRALLPDNDLVKKYHDWLYQTVDRYKPEGAPIVPEVAGAPKWAILLRETWKEAAFIADWWMENRLVENGELGGGTGDDTDFFQMIQSLPMIESAPLGQKLKKVAAQLSDGVSSHSLEEGMNKTTMDSLHAYEEGPNQLALCAQWFYGDPVHFERVMISARSAIKLLYETKDGRLHFGSHYVSIKNVRHGYFKVGKTHGDGNWAPDRFLFHPVYVAAMYNKNPHLIKQFGRWGETWANYQKPGHFVGRVEIETGKPLIVTPKPSAQGVGPVREWLALYHITGDKKWQKPCELLMDSGYWGTASEYGRCPHPLFKWDQPYQDKMKKFKAPRDGYAAFFAHKDISLLYPQLNDSLAWLQRTREMSTDGEPKTDRIILYKLGTAVSCYLGDAPTRNRYLDLRAVSYEGLKGTDFAGLVWDAGTDRLKLSIYNFKKEKLTGTLRLHRLFNGNYEVRTGIDNNDDGTIDNETEKANKKLQRYSSLNLTLEPQKITVIEIKQLEKYDNIKDRADPALSPIDTKLDSGTASVKLHNIGAKAARDVKVIMKRKGKVIAEKTIPEIAAPIDLKPKIIALKFDSALTGDIIIVDPDNAVAEISEHNNKVILK
ncbi:MAG: hypothetical protein ACYTFY_19900 [Planctomycetota bacterium]